MKPDRMDNALTSAVVNAAFVASILICLALGLGFFKHTNPTIDTQTVVRLIAAALATFIASVAFSLFVLRRRSTDRLLAEATLSSSIEQALNRVNPNVDAVFVTRDQLQPFDDVLREHASLWMAGMALRTITTDHLPTIRRFLEAGKTARFLIVEPHSSACDVIASSFFDDKTPEDYSHEVGESLSALSTLIKLHPRQIEVRLLNYVPATSVTILDARLPSEELVLEVYTYATSTGRPHVRLNPQVSPRWHRYFVDEFESMWRQASSWYKVS